MFAVVSPEIEALAREVGGRLKRETGLDSLPSKGFQLHCPLYASVFPSGELALLPGMVASLARTFEAFPVETAGVTLSEDRWLLIRLKQNSELQRVSDALVQALSPRRLAGQAVPPEAAADPAKKALFDRFGSPWVMTGFEPRLTLLAPTAGEALTAFVRNNASDPLFLQPVAGRVVAIGVGVADLAGQMRQPLAVLPLVSPASAPAR